MSTRCMIGLYENSKKKIHLFDSLIYKHSDGYPQDAGVLQVLFPMLNSYVKHSIVNVNYLTATIIFFIKKQQWEYFQKLYNEMKKEKREKARSFWDSEACRYFYRGVGTGKNEFFHTDLRYYYRLNIDKEEILVYKTNDKFSSKQWDENNMEQYFNLLYVIPFSANMPKDITLDFLISTYGVKDE